MMLHAISFNQGTVNYQNRWIRTEKFLAERHVRRSLFGGMRDGMVCDDSVKDCSRNTANTNVIWHHNQLLALNEGSLPFKINKKNLGEGENYFFNKMLDRSMMAHPKIDPVSGELLFYSYFGPDFQYFIADKYGKINYRKTLVMPFNCMMHDFAITENFTVFPLFPLTWDFQRVMQGEPIFKWEPQLNTRFGILPRYGNSEDMLWFEDQATLGFHVVNAYEEEQQIILEMVAINDIPANAQAFGDDTTSYVNFLTRWTFDLRQKTVRKEIVDDKNVEFPRMDERYTGRNNQHAFMNATQDKNLKHLFDSIIHYDRKTGMQLVHHFGKKSFPLEPIFVPRSKNSKEGDGFLLSYVYREKEKRSDLVILNASRLDDEPMGIVQLPHRVPFGFHGCWVESND